MKKGFTLVELIAVVVILGIILVIAVPRITDVINNARINAVIKNEEMLIRATKNYLVSNNEKMPTEIGGTEEVTLEQLQTEELIQPIKSPFINDNCNGYVLVTKIDGNSYDYTPHLNCVDPERGSASTDGLVLHYKFNDFQEPTENLLHGVVDPTFESGSVSGWGVIGASSRNITSELLFNNKPVMKITASSSGASGINVVTSARVPANTIVTMSMWIYIPSTVTLTSNWEIHRHSLPDGQCSNGTCHHYTNIDTTNTTWNNNTEKDKWIKRTVVIRTGGDTTVSGYNLRIFCYATSANPAGSYIYMSQPQIEVKPYDTPFTPDFRSGIITDHSIKNNHATLDENTPRWVDESSIGNGAYEFNGIDNVINFQPILLQHLDYTVSAWIKRKNLNQTQGIVTDHQYAFWSFFINSSNKLVMLHRGLKDGDDHFINQVVGQKNIGTEWTHVAATFDQTVGIKVYVNGFLDNANNETTTFRLGQGRGPQYIGQYRNGAPGNTHVMNGLIDNVRIYNRALSSEEIEQMYELSLRR